MFGGVTSLQLFACWAHSHPPLFVFPHTLSLLIMLILSFILRVWVVSPIAPALLSTYYHLFHRTCTLCCTSHFVLGDAAVESADCADPGFVACFKYFYQTILINNRDGRAIPILLLTLHCWLLRLTGGGFTVA